MDDQDGLDRDEGSQIPWHEILGLVLRRWKLITAVFVVGLLSATVFAVLRPPVYRAAAKLMVTADRAHITVSPDPGAGATVDRLTDQSLNAEGELLKSLALVREVLGEYRDPSTKRESLGWLQPTLYFIKHPLDVLAAIYRRLHNVPAPTPFEAWARSIAVDLSVTPNSKTSLIEVAYIGNNPQWVAKFVNDLVRHHVERRAQLNRQSEALRFLEGQRVLLSEKVGRAEEALQKFYEREGMDSMPEQAAAIRNQLAASEMALRDANTQFAESSARAEFLGKEILVHPQSIPGESILGQANPGDRISARVMDLELQRSQLLSNFAPNSIMIQDIDRQLADAKRLLAGEEKRQGGTIGFVNTTHQSLNLDLAQTRAQLAALKGRTEALREQIATYHAKLQKLNEINSEQQRLSQEVASAKETLASYLKKVEAARFSNALDESNVVNVNIVEPAEAPAGPMEPKTNMIILFSAIMSLAAGVGVAFVRDRLDPTLKSAIEARKLTGLPILSEIPL